MVRDLGFIWGFTKTISGRSFLNSILCHVAFPANLLKNHELIIWFCICTYIQICSICFFQQIFTVTFAKIIFLKNAIQHIAIYLLTTIVLVASVGFSVCCMFGCHSELVADDSVDCCQKEVCELPAQQQKNDCPGCQSKYVSLDVDYLLASVDFKINFPAVASIQPVNCFSEKYTPLQSATPWENDLPPPLYGKALLPHIQSFLC